MKKQILTLLLLLFFGIGLYAQPKAVSEPRVIAKTNEPLQTPVWSSDGTTLSFTSSKNNGLWKVSSNGTNLRQLSAAAGAGKQLRASAVTGTNSLMQQMISNPAKVASQVEALQSLNGCLIFNPVLSPQGDKIVFQASNGKGLYVCNVDGSDLRSLGKGERATWTPDGKYIVVMLIADNGVAVTKGELISINVTSGTRNTLLSSNKYIALSPAVSPDGTKIAFEEYVSGAIYVMDIK